MPLAYLVATVVTGLGMLVASHVYMSRPEQVADALRCRRLPSDSLQPSAACIGGHGSPAWSIASGIGDSRVSLGQKFELASGLMEITYDTGAKVILQGPVTYSVEANGGYLAVGKLTGKLEKKGEGEGEGGS